MNRDPSVFETIQSFHVYRNGLPRELKVGFVPTMGALHPGHASLLKRSVLENDVTVLSIFINPTQFNDKSDFANYPKTWKKDFALAKECGVDIIITPTFAQLYPDNYRYQICESDFSKILCGKTRVGHFDGVLTVVMKLLNIVVPSKAYFGEKDFQQLQLIKEMVTSFFMPVQIISCPTLREHSGLAMSSRNSRLSAEGLVKAALIYDYSNKFKTVEEVEKNLVEVGFTIDYVEDYFGRRFVAAFLEGVRLIDNVANS